MSYPQAYEKYRIHHRRSKRIKQGGLWKPKKCSGPPEQVVQKVLEDVKEMPHLNTWDRPNKA